MVAVQIFDMRLIAVLQGAGLRPQGIWK